MAVRPNTPPRPIIVKKVIEAPHGGHHGGAWKVAYADFVTAMMAFFLLMWLLGATTEKQRKALADYFAPTIVTTKMESAGSNGMFGGDSIVSVDDYPHAAGQTGTRTITIPRDVVGGPKEASGRESEKMKFQQVAKSLMERVQKQGDLKRLSRNLRFTETIEGMRIDVIDDADFSMFALGTSQLTPQGGAVVQRNCQAGCRCPQPGDDPRPYRRGTLVGEIGHEQLASFSRSGGGCPELSRVSRHRFGSLFAHRRGRRSRALCPHRPIRSTQSPYLDHPRLANRGEQLVPIWQRFGGG